MLSSILGCHNDSLVLLVLFEDIHIQTGSVSVLGVRQSSSWHPKEKLELTHIMLCSGVTRQAVSLGRARRLGFGPCLDWRFSSMPKF